MRAHAICESLGWLVGHAIGIEYVGAYKAEYDVKSKSDDSRPS